MTVLLAVVEELASESGGHMIRSEAGHATESQLALVHPASHIAFIRQAAERANEAEHILFLDPDTAVSPRSWDAACAAAGSLVTAVDAVSEGSTANAFSAIRPPGHHASRDRAMGFCLFNNVAVGARYAQEKGFRRVLIVDWDVHHGNGTEAIFYEDPDVFYLSMHQFPHYPGTGHGTDRGRGPGMGTTLNLPVPPGLPAGEYVERLSGGLDETLRSFEPDIIFISAGFDSAAGDPLAGLTLSPEDFGSLTQTIRQVAEARCDGRLISVLEGGYHLENLAACAAAHIRALADNS